MMHDRPGTRTRLAAVLAIAGLLAGCGGGDLTLPGAGSAAAIRVVTGDDQTGAVGEALPAPVVVEVTDSDGDPVSGVTVEFVLTSAGDGGDVTPETAQTNAGGRAEAHVLLGDKVGLQTGEARVPREGGTPPTTTFSAVALSDDNLPPDAEFDWACDGLACRFTDASADDDGSVTGWTWAFGDGTTSTAREPSHRYDDAGTYTVTLTVTDDEGADDDSSEQLTATGPSEPPANAPPQADFELDCNELRCTFTDASSDADGTVVSREWEFGDGGTSTERNPTHTYAAAGRYEVRLVVTDDDGAQDDRTRTAEPEAPAPPPEPNDPPHAEFDVACEALRCDFSDRSDDEDGNVVSWAWDFGDGATSTERSPTHTYAAPGRYDVVLVVTDDDGATHSRTKRAEPKAPEPNHAPRPEFEVHCDHLACTFEDESKDDDGTIVRWQWDFDDGAGSGDPNPEHTYAAPGHYDVTLTVTDDDGATATKTHRADPKD